MGEDLEGERTAAEDGRAESTGASTATPPTAVAEAPPPPDPADRVTDVAVPARAEPPQPTPLKAQWIVAALVVGVLADLALRRIPWNNVALCLVVLGTAAGLLVSGYVRTRSSRLMLVGAVVFGVFLALRTGDLLTVFNLLAAAGLLLGAALLGRHGGVWDLTPSRILSMALATVEQIFITPIVGVEEGVARYKAGTTGNGPYRSVFRGLALAVPVIGVLGALLASADAVFRSFFSGLNFGIGPVLGHLILIVIGALVMATLLRLAAINEPAPSPNMPFSLGHIEAGVILGSMAALFAIFSLAQLMTVMGGADDALARAGLEPKQFARQGFFQLLWVAAITLAVVMTIRALTAESDKGRAVVKWIGLVTVALTMVVVAVALTRIFFYIGDSGLTAKRLYATTITIWIAISFVLLAVRLAGYRPTTAWLTPACMCAAVVVLGIVNLANPNRRIAEDNLNRDDPVLVWHIRENQFVGEGRAVLADNLDQLSPDLATQVEALLCTRYGGSGSDDGDWLSYNRGRNQAKDAIDRLCRN